MNDRLTYAYAVAKAWAAFVAVVLAVYIAVGSWMFGDWWYGLMWGGNLNFTYVRKGWLIFLNQNFGLAVGIIIAVAIAVVVGTMLSRHVLQITKRFGGVIVFGAAAAILVTALVVYHTDEQPYRTAAALSSSISNLAGQYQELTARINPEIEPPIYFQYLDTERVQSLYNQIEPELEERERTVEGSTAVKGKAELGSGAANMGAEAGKETASKSTFTRSEPLPERKAVELMQYARKTWPDNYYSSDSDWYLKRVFSNTVDQFTRIASGETVNIPPFDPQQAKRTADLQKRVLQGQLGTLGGWAFVDGDFEKSTNGEGVILIRHFSDEPFKCSFRIYLPLIAVKSLPSVKQLHARVFGEVMRPLGNDGFIDLKGVAVY